MEESFKFSITHKGEIQFFKIGINSQIIIGRSNEEGQLPVDHPILSRKHLSLAANESGVFVEDMGSTNGSYLNGKRISSGQRFLLTDKDSLSLTPDNSVTVQ